MSLVAVNLPVPDHNLLAATEPWALTLENFFEVAFSLFDSSGEAELMALCVETGAVVSAEVPLVFFARFDTSLAWRFRLVLTVETTLCNSEDAEGCTASSR